ncbi:hypothetical protein IL38_00780 [Actinopolyspora erythraea]|uniref:Secreted protein n=1 Tax=Actinopolyspora erythraea TaxID=414996 RepID=A0ABR4XB55_9ACTN|nr:hypothetical protein IL38_00780 [Actinopolyspora erythraea]
MNPVQHVTRRSCRCVLIAFVLAGWPGVRLEVSVRGRQRFAVRALYRFFECVDSVCPVPGGPLFNFDFRGQFNS